MIILLCKDQTDQSVNVLDYCMKAFSHDRSILYYSMISHDGSHSLYNVPLNVYVSKRKNMLQKKSSWEKILRGNIPTGIFPHGENQNVIIYLKHTQMCQTDSKSESKLDFRPINRCLKNFQWGFFLQKSLRGKMKN